MLNKRSCGNFQVMFTEINNKLKQHDNMFDKFHEVNRSLADCKGSCEKLKKDFEGIAKTFESTSTDVNMKYGMAFDKLN